MRRLRFDNLLTAPNKKGRAPLWRWLALGSVVAVLMVASYYLGRSQSPAGLSEESRESVELYAEADMAVVPSLYEGFSLPAIEAMCTGTPLVSTDGGALPEVTGTDGETTLRCPAGDADALAATIARGLDDPELRARIGEAGRTRVLDRWTWRRCAELTVEQYREVLAMPANVAKLRANGRL